MHELIQILVKPRNPSFLSSGFAAFAGAFFAFSLTQIGVMIAQLEKRKNENYKSLIETNRILITATNVLEINRKILVELSDSLRKSQIYPKGLKSFEIPSSAKLELTSVRLLDKLVGIFERLRQFNYEWEVIDELYGDIKVLLKKDLPLDKVDEIRLKSKSAFLIDRLERIERAYKAFCSDFIIAIAWTEAQLDVDRPFLIRVRNLILKIRFRKTKSKRIIKHLKRIQSDQKEQDNPELVEIIKGAIDKMEKETF